MSQRVARSVHSISLHGFNNLTKSLSFNIYDICYTRSTSDIRAYLDYINDEYNTARLTGVLRNLASLIGANVLHISQADFDPIGASVTMLVSEEAPVPDGINNSEAPGPAGQAVVAHLDKSHLTVHTYPENRADTGICVFRADIDVSTCGMISPLKALNFLIHSFHSDIVYIDYRVRGFTRDVSGAKVYMDHPIDSIRNYLDEATRNTYTLLERNLPGDNIFHTRLCVHGFDLDDYLFNVCAEELPSQRQAELKVILRNEMEEIFLGRANTGTR